jgi:D-aminoacyl-tRNA deacylase
LSVLIISSQRDIAAQNIAQELIQTRNFQSVSGSSDVLLQNGDIFLKHVDTDSVYTDDLGVDFKPEVVIFASRHRSESGEPSLTVHWTGNPTSRADLGGNPKSLSFTDPPRLRAALLALDEACEARQLNYAVTMEATHHGPTELGVPTLFVEIGSGEEQWKDRQAASAVSEAIWVAATSPNQGKVAVGFGGGHYSNKHCNGIRKDGYAFSHILSKYFFEEYDEEIIHMAFERTRGECRTAVIDWKGVRGPDRARLLDTLEKMGVEVIRV